MKRNKVHISDLILYKNSAEEILNFLKKYSVKNLELFIEPLDEEYMKKMLYVLEHYTFKSVSFHGPFRKCNISMLTELDWKKVVYSYEESFKIAQKYSPSFMVLHTNEAMAKNSITEELKLEIKKRIDYIVTLAEQYEINIVVENVGIGANMIFSQEEYESLILNSSYQCLIDIGHAFLNHWNIETLIETLQNHILGFHFHNNDGVYDKHDPMFSGKIPYGSLLPIIRKYTPEAVIVLEYDFLNPKEVVIEDWKRLESLLST